MSHKLIKFTLGLLIFSQVQGAPKDDLYDLIHSKTSTTEHKCELQFLKELGWSFSADKANPEEMKPFEGLACKRESLWDAQDNGDLRILVNANKPLAGLEKFQQDLATMINSDGSMCAYKYRVMESVSSAVYKISKNTSYKFGSGPTRQFVLVDPVRGRDNRPVSNTAEWEPIDVNLRPNPALKGADLPVPSSYAGGVQGGCRASTCMQAKIAPSRALRTFYNSECYSECAGGLQIAQLTSLLELYGDEDLDKAFTRDEIGLGYWGDLDANTKNPFWYFGIKGRVKDDLGVDTGKIGKQAFIGMSGYIGNIRGERALDNPTDRGENFIIVNLTQRAADLLSKGELKNLNNTNKLIWEAYNSKNLKEANRLLTENPLYEEITVFVHPLGVWSFGKHIANLLQKNPRTEYAITFYPNTLNTSLYWKFAKYYVNKCIQASENNKPLKTLMLPLTPSIAQNAKNLVKVINGNLRTNYYVERRNATQVQAIMNDARGLGNYIYLLTHEGRVYVGSGAQGEFKETVDTNKGLRLSYMAEIFSTSPEQRGTMALWGITDKNEVAYLDPKKLVFTVSKMRSIKPEGVKFVKLGNDARKNFVARDEKGRFYVWEEDQTSGQWTYVKDAPENFIRSEFVIK